MIYIKKSKASSSKYYSRLMWFFEETIPIKTLAGL